METTVSRLDKENVEISFTIPKEEVDLALSRTYQQIASKQNIKGFRKGKVPRDVIKTLVGFETVAAMTLEEILSKNYMEACDKNEVYPIGQPEFDPWPTVKEEEPLEVKVKVKALPEFEVCAYDPIPVEFEGKIVVEDDEIGNTIENIKKSLAEYVPLIEDRGCIGSDEVKINYEVFEVNDAGVEQRTEKRDNASIKLGSGGTLPEIEQNIIGMKSGEKKEFSVEFPADYQRPSLAGKKAKYIVEVKEIKRQVPLESDEALIAKLGEKIGSMDMLRNDIRTTISNQKKEVHDRRVTYSVLSRVVDGTALDVPDELVDEELEQRMADLENILAPSGKSVEDYAEEQGKTLDEMKTEEREDARFAVKRRIIFNRIYSAEKMEILPHELERAVLQFAIENEMNQTQVKKLARNQDFISSMRQRLREAKVIALLKSKVVFSDGPADAGNGEDGNKEAPETDNVKKESGED